jgi:hypothetical protein
MANENEIQVTIDGNKVIETTIDTTIKEFDKAKYLADKEAELVAHDAGVEAYIKSAEQERLKLVALINDIK